MYLEKLLCFKHERKHDPGMWVLPGTIRISALHLLYQRGDCVIQSTTLGWLYAKKLKVDVNLICYRKINSRQIVSLNVIPKL